ncbi:MAG TPA: hypothetical protein VGM56_01695 [Byssovorax sp.]|jgi:hypothetical protein
MSETKKRGESRRQHAVVVRLDDAEREALLARALREGIPASELLRRGAGLVRGDAGAAPATSRRAS